MTGIYSVLLFGMELNVRSNDLKHRVVLELLSQGFLCYKSERRGISTQISFCEEFNMNLLEDYVTFCRIALASTGLSWLVIGTSVVGFLPESR